MLAILTEAKIIFGEQNSFSYCEFKGINNDILTCDKCIFNQFSTQTCLLSNNNRQLRINGNITDYLNITTTSQRTIPFLTNYWFNYDLAYMIQNNEVLTNLVNNTAILDEPSINNIIKNFKIIELNNFGIEILSKNAFEKFTKLKVLRLSANSINTIDFSSFLTNDSKIVEVETSKNQLIELDLSNNKIEIIKIENLMYFENLKILNLSRNHIRAIDLKLLSLISPHLQVFDVSYNYLQKFNLLNVNSNKKDSTSAVSYFYSIQLVYNYFLKDLIYINLSGNFLTSVLGLFSITNHQFENSNEYCNTTEGFFKRNSPIHLNIKSNPWSCDCLDFNFLMSIIDKTGPQVNRNDSCLVNLIFKKLNLFSINQHHNIELIKNLNCYLNQNETNWSFWYKNRCLKLSSTDENTNITTPITLPTSIYLSSTTTTTNRFFNLASKMYKYDVSSAFYWISSVCVAVVTITCLLIAWFYCWKRYRVSRRLILQTLNSTNNVNTATNTASICRTNTARCMQRRNIYLVNSRISNEQQQHIGSRTNGSNRNVTGLYYISLNRDANTLGGYSDIQNGGLGDDEPPNYYEAMSIKNNTRYSLNKRNGVESNLNQINTADNASSNSTTLLNINQIDANDRYSANGQSTDV